MVNDNSTTQRDVALLLKVLFEVSSGEGGMAMICGFSFLPCLCTLFWFSENSLDNVNEGLGSLAEGVLSKLQSSTKRG